MPVQRTPASLAKILIYWVPIILLMTAKVTHGDSNCHNRMDLAIAVDTTSSQSTSSFDAVKAEVKGIVSGLTVGQDKTRLALISMSKTASPVVNFKDVNSLSDFNAAVDRLTFSTDIVDLADGIKVAKDSVFITARSDKISKVLILVKDRRSGSAVVYDKSVLTRVTSEAAALKTLKAVIHVVGVGGLWSILELNAVFGTEYLLFLNKNKAFESVKSLNNKICDATCTGKSFEKTGLCYKSGKQIIKSAGVLKKFSDGLTQCRKEITREFSSCSARETCTARDRKISACSSDGKVKIENIWQSFDSKLQSCVTTTDIQTVDCKDALKCIGQVADVIFLLDKSGSMHKHFHLVKAAAMTLIDSLNVGKKNVRVGVITFANYLAVIHRLESTSTKASTLAAVRGIPEDPYGETTTHLALRSARESFISNGRSGVSRFVFVLTDGESSYRTDTFKETALIKNSGVTLYAIGIGEIKPSQEAELRTMTAPSSDTNMIFVKQFSELQDWSENFSKRMCIEVSAPHPKLCEDNVFSISISDCTNEMQQITKTEYKYDSKRKCIKTTKSTIQKYCRETCTDPITGNEYFHGHNWTSLCHDFQCSSANPLVPQRTRCFAADESCKAVGSPPFTCRDEQGAERNNCQCVLKNGKVTMQI